MPALEMSDVSAQKLPAIKCTTMHQRKIGLAYNLNLLLLFIIFVIYA